MTAKGVKQKKEYQSKKWIGISLIITVMEILAAVGAEVMVVLQMDTMVIITITEIMATTRTTTQHIMVIIEGATIVSLFHKWMETGEPVHRVVSWSTVVKNKH